MTTYRDHDINSGDTVTARNLLIRLPNLRLPRHTGIVGLLLVIHMGLLAWSATRHTPSVDEIGHLPAGLSHWKFGHFDLYSVNPPLVRMIATTPLLWIQPESNWSKYESYPGHRAEFPLGIDLYRRNGNWPFVFARWACIPFSVIGGLTCYYWSRELHGQAAGLFALGLWCFCPNVLGYGQLITPDLGAAAIGVAANYAFWKWMKDARFSSAVISGIMLGLTELTKFTWLILFPLWPILMLLWCGLSRIPVTGCRIGQMALIVLIAVYIIHVGYGFDGVLERLDRLSLVSRAIGGDVPSGGSETLPRNQFRGTLAGAFPLPFPKQFVLGIDVQKRDFERQMISYLRGEWRRGGWWYYYLYALALKTPVGMQLVFAVWLLVSITSGFRKDDLAWSLPALTLLAFVSSQTGMNHHLRYVLPIFPLIFVGISRVAASDTSRFVRIFAWLGLVMSSLASLQFYPHNLSFFNIWSGGPLGAPRHLLNSNIDWGQDLLHLRDWLQRHPEVELSGLAYYGHVPPERVGLTATVPRGCAAQGDKTSLSVPEPGWYALSVNEVYDWTDIYSCFRSMAPVSTAGYSIYIYHVTPYSAWRCTAAGDLMPGHAPSPGKSRQDTQP